jgi:two-component system response regulator DesR
MNGCNEILEPAGIVSAAPVCWGSRGEFDPIRIWLVDDNSSFRSLIASLLNEGGDFECSREFSSPSGVLKALQHESAPDIILLDIEMGAENGLDAIRPIKSLAKSTHVLMLTTFSRPGGRERAFREGASDFMLKTWPIAEIELHIRQAMEFGSVAGLLAAFLSPGDRTEKPVESEKLELAEKSSAVDRWLNSLRGWLKFSPS